MDLLRNFIADFRREAGPDPALAAAADRFVAWCEADLAAHPLVACRVEGGRVVLDRAAPRESAELPVGAPLPETPFRPVEATGFGLGLRPVAAVSAFDR